MLQGAANGHSWWWASHIRTKQSKWLEENLHDMDEKVTNMLKIIDCNGDSFSQRVEMYYKKRPELIGEMEESYRSYRALAEKYDHLSRDMQSVNRTIAAVFPEQVQVEIDDDYEGSSCMTSPSPDDTKNAFKVSKSNIPTLSTMPNAEFHSNFMSGSVSGLNHEKATEEIDNIKKDILALQTEREFIQDICERCNSKCCCIDNRITDMKARVRILREEFGIGGDIDDNEVQTLMAATTLKSCSETLDKLHQKQEMTAEKAKIENLRVKDLVKKFTNLQSEFQPNSEKHEAYDEEENENEPEELDKPDMELLQKNLKREVEADNSDSSFTVIQLAEKVDALVGKVIGLETNVSSQNALVMILRSEADTFQERIKTLEGEKEVLMENSEITDAKIKDLADELHRVRNLSQSVKQQTDNLQIYFTEASFKIDHLSEKLENVKADEEGHNASMIEEVEAAPIADTDKDQKNDGSNFSSSDEEKGSDLGQDHDVMPENHQVLLKSDEKYSMDTRTEVEDLLEEPGTDEEEGQLHSSHRLVGGLGDREKHIVDSLVLQNYKEVKEMLGDVQKNNRDGFFELALQIRELKNAIAMRNEEIHLLRKSNSMRKNEDENPCRSPESIRQAPSIPDSSHSTLSSPQQQLYDSEHDSHFESTGRMDQFSREDTRISIQKENKNAGRVDTSQVASAIEEKFRSDIDGLLEENLEFWLRFSNSFHQIHKYQSSIQELKAGISKLKDRRREEGNGKGQCIMSEAQPVYKHLREVQTELALWLETNAVLKDELQGRQASLFDVQEEISRISKANTGGKQAELSKYKAAQFQGEILNMKLENSKVSEELQASLERVNALRDEVGKLLSEMDEELGGSAGKPRAQRTSIPLRSFLFGVKLKAHKTHKTHKRSSSSSSFFSCKSPFQHDVNP